MSNPLTQHKGAYAMTPRQAVIATADLFEKQPAVYEFGMVRVPECGSPGCVLGYIGHFAGLPAGASVGNGWVGPCVARDVLGCPPDGRGYFATEFYTRMDSILGSIVWIHDAALAAKALRLYADKYFPEEPTLGGIPDSVRDIFNGAVTQEPALWMNRP